MSTINGISFQDPRNINLKGASGQGMGVIRFDTGNAAGWSASPIDSTSYGLYIDSNYSLVYYAAGVPVTLGGAGIGYATGAGGAVTQITSRTTGVTLNKLSGAITLVSAAGSATAFTMTVTNSTVAATDVVVVSQKSGTDAYRADVTAVAAGSFKLTIVDLTGTTTEQPVFNFVVLKGAAA